MPIFRTAGLLAALMLAGCGLSLPGRGGADLPVASAIGGEVIETSVLPDAAAQVATPAPATEALPPAAVRSEAAIADDSAPTAADAAGAEAASEPAVAPAAEPAVDAAAAEAAPAIPPLLQPAAAACAKTGGRFAPRRAGSRSFACFSTPSDAGESCSRASDCSSACLARSRTCAPAQPLFGCHEVLTEAGQRATQCLE